MQIRYFSKLLFYWIQFKAPWFHSCRRPKIKIIQMNADARVSVIGLREYIRIPKGRRSAISTSNTRKIIVIRKNRKENGLRDLLTGSNPHSKGESFSRSISDFFLRIKISNVIITAIIKVRELRKKIELIVVKIIHF